MSEGEIKSCQKRSWYTHVRLFVPHCSLLKSFKIKKPSLGHETHNKDVHEQNHHGGTSQMLADLSVQYWIMPTREAIEEWEIDCVHGKRRKAFPAKHIMPLYQNWEPGCRYEFSATHRSILVDSSLTNKKRKDLSEETSFPIYLPNDKSSASRSSITLSPILTHV